jgi:hypothetical protein
MVPYIRQDGTKGTRTPEVGDRVWFIGETGPLVVIKELEEDLKITSTREEIGQVTVKPVLLEDGQSGHETSPTPDPGFLKSRTFILSDIMVVWELRLGTRYSKN